MRFDPGAGISVFNGNRRKKFVKGAQSRNSRALCARGISGMNKSDKYGYWIMLADYDLETIEPLVQSERWVYVVSLCQTAVERQLKGMYVYHNDCEAPKTRNINFLFSKLAANISFIDPAMKKRFEDGKKLCEDYLIDLSFYYISDYPFSYKNITARFVRKDEAMRILERTRQQIGWMRSFQQESPKF